MTKTLIALVGIALLAAAGLYWYQDSMPVAEAGEYAYQCEDGSRFSMTPSASVAEVTLYPGTGSKLTSAITVHKMGDGNHFEAENVVFWGAGEEVGLEIGTDSTICYPVPNSEMAPWNWGDAGEGSGTLQDVVAAVNDGILGKWKSIDDPSFVREFKAAGVVADSSGGAVVSTGTYAVFSNTDARAAAFPQDGDTIYIQITDTSGALNFKLNKLSPDELELTYMDRGGVLRFTKVQ